MAMNCFKCFTYIILLIWLMVGCKPIIEKQKEGFSLNSFFNSEINLLKQKKLILNKTIVQGESVNSNKIKNPNWDKELAVFKQYGVIKFSQLKLYDIDTFILNNGRYFISYRSNVKQPMLKLIEIQFNVNKEIEKVTLIIQDEKLLNSHEINMTYLPQKGYDIKGLIESKVSKDCPLDIHGEISEN